MSSLFLSDAEATRQAGFAFAKKVKSGDIIYLHGELGAGKTTFVQGFLQGLGFKGVATSPTYTLVESYFLTDKAVFHFDLYRLKNPEELVFIGVEDYFTPQSICLVEWPERGGAWLPKPAWELQLAYENDGRKLLISKFENAKHNK